MTSESKAVRKGQPRRLSARTVATRERILLVAERLFGNRGIDDVSLREIAAEAGQANSNAVQYHFASKERLIEAILEYRVAQLEDLRRPMLAEAERQQKLGDMRTLLSVLFLPHLALTDDKGRHPFARFLSEYMLRFRPKGIPHPGDEGSGTAPLLSEILNRIVQLVYYLPEEIAHLRMTTCSIMFLALVVQNDLKLAYSGRPVALDVAVDEALSMMTAVMLAPPSQACRQLPPYAPESGSLPSRGNRQDA